METGSPSKWYGVVFDIWKDEPVFHSVILGDQSYPPWVTGCGRVVGGHKPLLPLQHLPKFARPCKTCFPGGRP